MKKNKHVPPKIGCGTKVREHYFRLRDEARKTSRELARERFDAIKKKISTSSNSDLNG